MAGATGELRTPERIAGKGAEQFWVEVFPAELDAINARIAALNEKLERERPEIPWEPREVTKAVGLALSGGGVRSAAFSLGALQALNAFGVINNVDYLSTVSGGGYVGGSMVATMTKTKGDFVFGAPPRRDTPPASDIRDTDAVGQIRNYSNFLIPFGLRDVLTSVAIVLRGLTANLGFVIPVLLIAAAVTIEINPTSADLTGAHFLRFALSWIPFQHFGVSIVLALLGLLLFFLWALFRSFLPQNERSEFRNYQRAVDWRERVAGWLPGLAVLYLLLTAAVFFFELQPFVISEMFRIKGEPTTQNGSIIGAVVANWVQYLAAATAPIAALVMFFRKQLGALLNDTAGRSGMKSIVAGVLARAAVWLAGAALPLLLWVAYLYLSYWGIIYTPKLPPPELPCVGQPVSGAVTFQAPGGPVAGAFSGNLSFEGGLPCASGAAGAATAAPPAAADAIFPGLAHAPIVIQRLALRAAALKLSAPFPLPVEPPALVYAAIGIVFLLLAYFMKPNANSLHRLYRDRLSKAFFFDPRYQARSQEMRTGRRDFMPLDGMKLHEISTLDAPYLLINTTLNIQGSDIANRRGRNGDFFVFSALFTGSFATCYAKTEALEDLAPDLDFPTAVAVSGAAASANMGSKSVRALTPTLALLNVRLGYWLENPHYLTAGGAAELRRRVWVYLYNELTGRLFEDTDLVYLTDGGHIENLGIYELLRRKCELIVVVDGEEDRDMRFTSFVTLQRYARIDLGVRIDMPWETISETTRDWMGSRLKPQAEPAARTQRLEGAAYRDRQDRLRCRPGGHAHLCEGVSDRRRERLYPRLCAAVPGLPA